MEVKIVDNTNSKFKPFSIQIDIESYDELLTLYYKLSLDNNDMGEILGQRILVEIFDWGLPKNWENDLNLYFKLEEKLDIINHE